MTRKSLETNLGLRIRNLRRAKKITLITLSDLTHIAQATLSRMETGLMLGTVKSHQKIAEVLGVSLSQIYEGIDDRAGEVGHLSADESRKVTAKTEQYKCELLTQEITKKKIMPFLVTLSPRGKSDQEQLSRNVEKFIYCLEGSVSVTVGGEDYPLEAEDTLYFDATIPHQVINTGQKQAKYFCAISQSNT